MLSPKVSTLPIRSCTRPTAPFLSTADLHVRAAKTNKRTDEYGQTPRDRLRLLFEIIDGIRKACPPDFCVSVKINSQDFVVRVMFRRILA